MDAAHLAKECRIAYGWSRRDSAFYVSEFLNFWMPLKAYAGDLDGTIISPPEIIDKVWHVALLDTKEYSDHCLRVLRVQFIHHSSKRAYDDQRTLSERRQNTLALFDQKWPGERDVSIWNFPSDRAAADSQQDARRSKRLKADATQWIAVNITTLTGRKFNVFVQDNSTVEALKQKIYIREGLPGKDQRLIFADQQLEDGRTLQSYNIKDHSVVHLALRSRGC
ncbi:hypothetical protein MP228_003616 [Amoeboaphelidium protococcarum]|nr:hypothetical protein MP228_003616 [Amoeboaphelidium protococcarum]